MAHRFLYHSTLGFRVIKIEREIIQRFHCRANVAQVRQSRPDSGLGFQGQVDRPF